MNSAKLKVRRPSGVTVQPTLSQKARKDGAPGRDDRSLFWAAVPVSAMLAVALLCVAFISVRWLLHSRLTFAAIESTALRSQFRELTLDFLRLYSVCLGVVLLAVFMAYAMLQGTR